MSGDFLGREMRARLRMPAPAVESEAGAADVVPADGFGGGPAVIVRRGENLNEQIRERVFGGGAGGGTEFTVTP